MSVVGRIDARGRRDVSGCSLICLHPMIFSIGAVLLLLFLPDLLQSTTTLLGDSSSPEERAGIKRDKSRPTYNELVEPYPDLFGHDPHGNPPVTASPDPLVEYTWPGLTKIGPTNTSSNPSLQIYRVTLPPKHSDSTDHNDDEDGNPVTVNVVRRRTRRGEGKGGNRFT